MNGQVDERLWRIAKKRAGFKKTLMVYVVVNLFVWAVWWITQGREQGFRNWGDVWPVWVTLGWGLGLAFQYFGAYGSNSGQQDAVEKEYEKLKQQQ